MKTSRLHRYLVAIFMVSLLGVGGAWAGDRSSRGHDPKGSHPRGYQNHRPDYNGRGHWRPQAYRHHRPSHEGPRHSGPYQYRPRHEGPRVFGPYQAYRPPYHHGYKPRHHHNAWISRPHHYRPHYYPYAPTGAYGFGASIFDSGSSFHFGFSERW